MVIRSASAWHGWCSGDSMFTTGTVACSASVRSWSSSPVRRPIATTWRESTSAVSRSDSPRVSWRSPARSTIGWPPSSTTPASNETRVRVDGFSNSSATERPASAREEAGAALRASARSSSDVSTSRVSSVPSMKCIRSRRMRVLTWNLYHGRSRPSSGRPLLNEFATALDGWAWDVALLQEVPPWWPPMLARACRAEERTQLTSRNWLLPVRRAISERNPDILKSNGGGANAILVRGRILEHRSLQLRRAPEGRWVHGVRLADGAWAVNVHSHNHPAALALADTRKAIEAARDWARGAPLIFGGDINLK